MTAGADVSITLAERGARYGRFVNHAEISQALKEIVLANNAKLSADQQEALDMICHKMARILNGDPNYADSWLDIEGYARLVRERLEGGTPR